MNISCFFDISAKQLGVYNFLDLFQNFFIVKNTIAILHGQKFKNLDPPSPFTDIIWSAYPIQKGQ